MTSFQFMKIKCKIMTKLCFQCVINCFNECVRAFINFPDNSLFMHLVKWGKTTVVCAFECAPEHIWIRLLAGLVLN